MIIRFFSTALFLMTITSCSKVDENTLINAMGTYDSNSINFLSQTSKAFSNDIETMQSDTDGFTVYGEEAGSSSWYNYLDGNRYIYDTTWQIWEWESTEDPSWPEPFNQMNFYALYPTAAIGFTLSATTPSSMIGEIIVQPSILDQTDFLASTSGDIIARPSTGLVSLNFTHIMSKISFSVLQDAGVLTVIRQLGIENIINVGSYDYINSEWSELSNNLLDSFDDYVGSAGPFAKYGVENQVDPIRIDGHYLMLIPQAGGDNEGQTPIWDGTLTVDNDSGEGIPNGAYISIRYRTSINNDTEDLIGHAIREGSSNDTEWIDGSYFHSVYKREGGTYTGPLFVKAGFKLSSELLNWVAGTEYDYTLLLNKTGGIYLSKYYYDVDGTNTKIEIDSSPNAGDTVFTSDITPGITIDSWNYSQYEITIDEPFSSN